MKDILKISPIVLFGITISLMLIPYFDNDMEQNSTEFGIWASLALSLILFTWYYSIGNFLHVRYQVRGYRLFKFNFFFLVILLSVLCIGLSIGLEKIQEYNKYLMLCLFYFFFAFFQMLIFCAQLLAMEDHKRAPKFSEYFQYIILLWFFPIGIWFVQSKMNKISS